MDSLFEKKAVFSLEVFPPKDSTAIQEIYASLGRFRAVRPDYISVTFGAGGSTRGGTVEIASDIKNKFGVESVAHLTCAGSTKADVDGAAAELKARGITRILALRGDLKDGLTVKDFRYATDLIAYLKRVGDFSIAAACYPEGHIESQNAEQDLRVLERKADLGVTHFISQLFFDNADFLRMREKMAARGICQKVQAGIMPVTNPKQILRIIGLCGAKLPAKLSKILSRFENNREAVRAAGINYALEQITGLLAEGVDGIHLYTMNSPRVAEQVAENIRPLLDEVNRDAT